MKLDIPESKHPATRENAACRMLFLYAAADHLPDFLCRVAKTGQDILTISLKCRLAFSAKFRYNKIIALAPDSDLCTVTVNCLFFYFPAKRGVRI